MATAAQIEAYKSAKRHDWPFWSTDDEIDRRADAWAYAGPNAMQHHEGQDITAPGMTGAAQMFLALASVERAKARAGWWLREARYLRRLGYARDARRAMSEAARSIRFARTADPLSMIHRKYEVAA